MSSTIHFPDADNFQRQADDFIAWLSQKPGVRISPKIQVTDLRGQAAGRGVVAKTEISDGEELFAIPRDIVLTVQNSNLRDQLPQREEFENLGPWLSLMLVMIYEYLQGERSAWSAYFRVLPTRFDTLMFWSKFELAELQASAVVDKIGKQGAEESILEMVAPIVRVNPALFPPVGGLPSYDGPQGERAILELAHMMGSLIMAYAFDIEKPEDEEEDGEDGYVTDEEDELPKGMVPLADLLNADADRNNARLFQEEELLVMKTIKPIHQGEEIFNDYGQIPRSDLLRRYGYVTDNYASYDVVELPLDVICSVAGLANADPETQPQLKLLEDLEILDDGYIIPRPSAEDSLTDILPDELLALAKTLTLTPEQLLQQQSKNKPPKPVLNAPEATLLLKAVQKRQSQYATNLEQDQQILASLKQAEASGPLEGSSRRQKMAVEVRLGEKEILQRLSAMFSDFIASNAGQGAKRNADNSPEQSRQAKSLRT
ncbi:Ribosomal lysine N-methyltransferase 4 [Paecilomyces lecythidis]